MEEYYSGAFEWNNTAGLWICIFAGTHTCYTNMAIQHIYRRYISSVDSSTAVVLVRIPVVK